MSSCSCGWQAVKKSLEAGSHFKENCFILLLPKGQLSRLRDWELQLHPQDGADQDVARLLLIQALWEGSTAHTSTGEVGVGAGMGTGSKAEMGTKVGSTTVWPELTPAECVASSFVLQ